LSKELGKQRVIYAENTEVVSPRFPTRKGEVELMELLRKGALATTGIVKLCVSAPEHWREESEMRRLRWHRFGWRSPCGSHDRALAGANRIGN